MLIKQKHQNDVIIIVIIIIETLQVRMLQNKFTISDQSEFFKLKKHFNSTNVKGRNINNYNTAVSSVIFWDRKIIQIVSNFKA